MKEKDNVLKDKYFIPIDDNELLQVPTTYTEPEPSLRSSELASFSLKPSKTRFLRPLLKLAGLTLLALAGLEMVTFVQNLAQWHWSLGYLSAGLFVTLLIMLLLVIRSYRANQAERQSVAGFRDKAQQIKDEKTFGQVNAYVADLEHLYEDKPQEPLLKQAISSLPDYNNDVEVLNHLSQHFFNGLDKRALEIISRYSQQTGLLVAISPLAIADMLLSIWRMLKMVDEIGQVYGLRPSLPGRLMLSRELLNGMALAGASELVADAVADFSTSSAAGIVSSRIGQGIGVGLYVARIGIRTMALCRPVPFELENKPRMIDIVPSIKTFIADQLGAQKNGSQNASKSD